MTHYDNHDPVKLVAVVASEYRRALEYIKTHPPSDLTVRYMIVTAADIERLRSYEFVDSVVVGVPPVELVEEVVSRVRLPFNQPKRGARK